jgi:hypothetical protein
MTRRNEINLFLALLFATVLALACSGGNEMHKASDLVGEANAANAEAAKNIDDVDKRFAQLFGSDVDLDDRKKFEPTAKDALASLEKAHAKLAEGIQKLDAAGKLKIEDWYKDYVATVAQSFRNTDQRIDVMKETANLYMDYSLDAQTLKGRYKDLLERDDKIQKQATEIDAKIKQIEEANKGKLKS